MICLAGIFSAGQIFGQDTTRAAIVRDSLATFVKDSLSAFAKDSLPALPEDSLATALRDSTALADSLKNLPPLTPKALKQRQKDSLKFIRDSIRTFKDSVRMAKPRILETPVVPDTLSYKRILTWNNETYYNRLAQKSLDTTYNDWYTEYPFFKQDVNATYLGVIGSATENHNYFRRDRLDIAPFFTPYLSYSYTPETLPHYNTKSPYTELAYWGTLLSNKNKEEANIKLLHTQNITPAFNLALLYQRFGGRGHLEGEATDNRTFSFSGNYLGKRYVAHAGFIHHRIKRSENGGVIDTRMIRDTIVDSKVIKTNLLDAGNNLLRNTYFISHTYGIPIRFKKGDTTAVGDGTMAYIGHYGEYSYFSKSYFDHITDDAERRFYNDKFYIHPSSSADSLGLHHLENRIYIKLQPWAKDAILSQIEGGIGHQYRSLYNPNRDLFISPRNTVRQNNLYVYAGVGGKLKKYFDWDVHGKYQFAGYYQNDFDLNAKVKFSFFPFKDKKEPIDLTARFVFDNRRPDYYSNHLYTNHYVWNNNFNKISNTKIEGQLDIPKWKLSAFFGYALVGNHVYYDTLGVIRQSPDNISVMSAYLQKNFKVWHLRFDHQILFQLSSNQDVLPLPMLSTHFRYYFEFTVVKNAMTMQIGADATWNTKYYAPAYNPALGQFQVQHKELVGNCPYIDVFVNVQWKRASIFMKLTNTAQGWPTADYFSAYQYIKPKREFKLGIHWPFYIH